MKKFLKVVVWIVILGGICFGVYTILPEYPHNFAKSVIQPIVNNEAKLRISQVKSIGVGIKGLDGVTYETALENNTGSTCWVYERDETTGEEKVIFYGRGASINMKNYTDYNGKLYTSAIVKFEFIIVGNNVEIIPYIDGEKMNIKDGTHVEQNKEVLKMIVTQLYSGMQSD